VIEMNEQISTQTVAFDSAQWQRPVTGHGPAKVRLRMTRRGRMVIVAALLAAVSPFLGLGTDAEASEPTSKAVEVVVHTVEPGETLWQLDRSITPAGQDVRDVIRELQKLNELHTADLQIGQTVLLPAQ